ARPPEHRIHLADYLISVSPINCFIYAYIYHEPAAIMSADQDWTCAHCNPSGVCPESGTFGQFLSINIANYPEPYTAPFRFTPRPRCNNINCPFYSDNDSDAGSSYSRTQRAIAPEIQRPPLAHLAPPQSPPSLPPPASACTTLVTKRIQTHDLELFPSSPLLPAATASFPHSLRRWSVTADLTRSVLSRRAN